jgi:hypothetical protein
MNMFKFGKGTLARNAELCALESYINVDSVMALEHFPGQVHSLREQLEGAGGADGTTAERWTVYLSNKSWNMDEADYNRLKEAMNIVD